jgi:hypothetical protein
MPNQSHDTTNFPLRPDCFVTAAPRNDKKEGALQPFPHVVASEAKQSHLFFGIDLTSSPAKPSACLALDDELQPIYFWLHSH